MYDNQPYAGGWRFGNRPTSVEALYTPQAVNNDFLKQVASLQDPSKKGLLDQAVTASPLQGLLEAPGSTDGFGDIEQRAGGQRGGPASGPTVMSEAGNPMTQVSAGGLMANMGNAAKGFAALGIPGLLGGLFDMQRKAPVYDMIMPGMNGYRGNDYGLDPSLNGPPTEQMAQTLADKFAKDFAAYAAGGGGFSSSPGVGGLGAGGSPDGYW